jgi:hypothetical protein
MEDPVRVFGRIDNTACRDMYPHVSTTITCIHIPDTDWYMHDIMYDGDDHMTRMYSGMYMFPMSMVRVYDTRDYHWIGKGIVLSSMVIERSRLLKVIERYIQELHARRLVNFQCLVKPRLEAWKAQLVLKRIRRNMSARTVQRQFRECMSNPGYALCKRRLLREFAEGIT